MSVAAGLLLDRVLREPPDRWHPVAWFGNVMQRVESGLWADRRVAGVGYTIVGVSIGAAAGVVLRSTAIGVAVSVAGRSLRSTASQIEGRLRDGDLEHARLEVRSLVGRDPRELDESALAAAVVESVAENMVDAVVAPAFWGLIGGAPGALAYRAVNTMDAMVGHRSDRYERFGWASARLDDVANLVPARGFALLVAAAQPRRASAIARTVRRDAGAHPSPNAGVAEAAMAAVLGVELGGSLRYGERVEERPALGTGRRPRVDDIGAATRVADRVEVGAAAMLLGFAAYRLHRDRERS